MKVEHFLVFFLTKDDAWTSNYPIYKMDQRPESGLLYTALIFYSFMNQVCILLSINFWQKNNKIYFLYWSKHIFMSLTRKILYPLKAGAESWIQFSALKKTVFFSNISTSLSFFKKMLERCKKELRELCLNCFCPKMSYFQNLLITTIKIFHSKSSKHSTVKAV